MSNPAQPLIDFKKEKDFLVCIDSDGCAFDAMEIKHKECFTPEIIRVWGLQSISKYAREAAEFVNLYSQWRGTNRFPALIKIIELLSEREEVVSRGFKLPDIEALKKWVESEPLPANPALEKAVKETNDPVLKKTLEWSLAVNEAITRMVHGVPPFPFVLDSLKKVSEVADIIVVSATPGEALNREWTEHGLAPFVKVIAGQEMGTKKDHIMMAMEGRYEKTHVIKLGDALGDLKAAKANDVNFFPINPGSETESWKQFHDVIIEKFISMQYAGEFENNLIENFKNLLPVKPHWKTV